MEIKKLLKKTTYTHFNNSFHYISNCFFIKVIFFVSSTGQNPKWFSYRLACISPLLKFYSNLQNCSTKWIETWHRHSFGKENIQICKLLWGRKLECTVYRYLYIPVHWTSSGGDFCLLSKYCFLMVFVKEMVMLYNFSKQTKIENSYTNKDDMNQKEKELEAHYRLQLNRKLDEINNYLEQQARARERLDNSRDESEYKIKDAKRKLEVRKILIYQYYDIFSLLVLIQLLLK